MAVYLIDNASTDNSINTAKSISDRVKIIALTQNFGFAGGYNEGLKQVDTEIIILLNSDIEVTSNWCIPLINRLTESISTGAVVPKIKSYKNKDQFEYAGGAGGFLDKHGYAFCRGRLFEDVETDEGQYDTNKSVAWGSGCALALRSDLFHALGGFDTSYFAHFEEIDLAWRIRRAGYSIDFISSATVFHLGGGTMSYASNRKLYLNFRNSLFTLFKNLVGWSAFRIIFSRMCLDGLAAAMFLLKGNPQSFLAVFRAHLSFYNSIGRLKKRKLSECEMIEKVKIGKPNSSGIKNISIIWQYFVEGRRKFTDLKK